MFIYDENPQTDLLVNVDCWNKQLEGAGAATAYRIATAYPKVPPQLGTNRLLREPEIEPMTRFATCILHVYGQATTALMSAPRATYHSPDRWTPTASSFALDVLQKIQALLSVKKKEAAFRELYGSFDRRLQAGEFAGPAALLSLASSTTLPLSVLLGMLTVTGRHREVLADARSQVVEAVRRRATQEGGESKARALLAGLE